MLVVPQSGNDLPNSIPGLLLWLDASEPGTLSRKTCNIYDKSTWGATAVDCKSGKGSKILQSHFNGKTAIRLDNSHYHIDSSYTIDNHDHITAIAVFNGQLYYDKHVLVSIGEDGKLIIPHLNITPPTLFSEILLFDSNNVTQQQLDDVEHYLRIKWLDHQSNSVNE